jgi:hypothetical protein
MRMSARGGLAAGLLLLLLMLFTGPAAAQGAVRHAAPNGTGPAASCPVADPCEIEDAIEDPSVADGDVIVLAGGDYNVSSTLTVLGEITVRGKSPGHAGARIITDAPTAGILMITPAAVVRDVTVIKNGNSGRGVSVVNGTLDRAQVIAPAAIACELGSVDANNARIKNTTCSAGGDAAARISLDGPGLEFGVLENVTAYSSTNQTAIRARGVNNGQVQLNGRNVIALGGMFKDIVAEDDDAGASTATVTMSSSSYNGVSFGPGPSSVTPIGSGTNIGGAALLDPAGRDFRQLPNSQTIDAGILPPNGAGPVDYAGEQRVQGAAIDIGADEAVDPERILRLLGKRVKAKRTLKIKARCQDAPCEISGRAIVKPMGSKKKTRRLGATSAAAGSGTKVKVKLPRKLAKRLRRKGGRVKVRARGTDPVGFTDTERKIYKVKKRRKK